MHTWNDTNFTGEDRQSIIKSHCRINFNRCKNKHSSINMVEPYFMDQYNIYIMVANSIASRQLEKILRATSFVDSSNLHAPNSDLRCNYL